jgi:uncharacterized protein YegP (UPF0339 family)
MLGCSRFRSLVLGEGLKIVVWKAKDGFRWKTIAENGKIVSESGEAYERQTYALEAAERFRPADAEVEIEDETEG